MLIRTLRLIACVVLLLAPVPATHGGQARVTRAVVSDINPDARTAMINLDVGWTNSWSNATNWDAVWVFVKFRAPGMTSWEHAALSNRSTDHHPGAGARIDAVHDGRGVFITSATEHSGNVAYTQNKLLWNIGNTMQNVVADAKFEIVAYAIEMVYIPPGPFQLGAVGKAPGHFYKVTDSGETDKAYTLDAEGDSIVIGPEPGQLCYTVSPYGGPRTYDNPSFAYAGSRRGELRGSFPKGVAAFYAMKSPLSPRHYQDFLKNLPEHQAKRRTPNGAIAHWGLNGGKSLDSSMICLFWSDMLAFADWAGLRPLTEFEYEKMCRGTAASPAKSAGSPYWAVDEPVESKSEWERFVTVGLASGRAFTGRHGDGSLNTVGDADVRDWPGVDSTPASEASGSGNSWPSVDILGSGHRQAVWLCRGKPEAVCDRTFAAGRSSHRFIEGVWRGGRTAPSKP